VKIVFALLSCLVVWIIFLRISGLFRKGPLIYSKGRAGLFYCSGKKKLKINSELIFEPRGGVCIFPNSTNWRWQPPNDGLPIAEEEREKIINDVVKHYERRGKIVVVART
jgi:hypothetical protein